MASIYGTGRNWGAIKSRLEEAHLSAGGPSDIEPLLESCQAEYEAQIKQVRQKLKNEIAQLRQEILETEGQARTELASATEDNAMAIEQSEAVLDVIKEERSPFSALRNFFRSRREKDKLTNLRTSMAEQHTEIQKPLQSKQLELEQKKAHIDELARQECQEVLNKIEVLRGILGSPELAGATAEAELSEALSALPENFHVLQDVEVSLDKSILFEGLWLASARIDALVLSPSGLFAIELKNWTKFSAEKESGSNLFDHIRRAAQLCHESLKSEFPGLTVRSILAYRGRPPESINAGVVKALPLGEVAGYISWFKDNTLSERSLFSLLSRLASQGGGNIQNL